MTSLRLFKSPEGDPFSPLREVRVTLDDGRVIVVPRDGVVLPMGNLVDVALLRAAVPAGSFTPIPLAWAPPAIASAFEIAGYDGAGNPATITAHVRFASTRLLVGDRDISGLAGCIGAPAIGLDRLYGIVSECEPNRAPVITRLSMAYSFLARNLPGLQPRPTLKEQP